jgi:hypothetical protein
MPVVIFGWGLKLLQACEMEEIGEGANTCPIVLSRFTDSASCIAEASQESSSSPKNADSSFNNKIVHFYNSRVQRERALCIPGKLGYHENA